MSIEKYTPSSKEIQDAEGAMSKEQRLASDFRGYDLAEMYKHLERNFSMSKEVFDKICATFTTSQDDRGVVYSFNVKGHELRFVFMGSSIDVISGNKEEDVIIELDGTRVEDDPENHSVARAKRDMYNKYVPMIMTLRKVVYDESNIKNKLHTQALMDVL